MSDAIFLKSWWLTHSKYDDRYLTLVILFMPVTLVTLFRLYNQFYRAECITVSGFLSFHFYLQKSDYIEKKNCFLDRDDGFAVWAANLQTCKLALAPLCHFLRSVSLPLPPWEPNVRSLFVQHEENLVPIIQKAILNWTWLKAVYWRFWIDGGGALS